MIPTRPLRRPRVLIVGFGDVGRRIVPLLAARFRVLAITRRERQPVDVTMPDPGGNVSPSVRTIRGDLDYRRGLGRAGALCVRAFAVFHCAPPPGSGPTDPRTQALLAAAGRSRGKPAHGPRHARTGAPRLVYISTTGVYGDCGGALVPETRLVAPANARAIRRTDAEARLRKAAGGGRFRLSILRTPGIYGDNRLPVARLTRGTPVLAAEDDVFTNHIHADDLAAIAVRTLWRGRPQRVYHASDDSRLKMGDYIMRMADALQLPRPPRVSRAVAEATLEPTLLSFMRESRRLDNRRLHEELRYRLLYPTIDAFIAARAAGVKPSGG